MRLIFCLPAALALAAAPAFAQAPPVERPEVFTRLVDCRSLAAPEERLACYDREVAALDAAEASNELVVLDRQQMRRTRRTLFGLTLPDLGLFSDENEEEGSSAIETTIRGAAQNGLGKWIITLEDGARWIQIDSRELAREPRSGQPIRIRRAAMGSYLANVNNQIAIRMRRVQ